LIDQHPLVQAVDAKLADLERKRTDFENRVVPLARADAEAQLAYDAAVSAALLEGGPMPTRPVRQVPEGLEVDLRNGFFADRQQLTLERREAVAAALLDVLGEARRQAKKVVTAARPTVDKLNAFMVELGELLGAVKTCRDFRNATNPDGRRQFLDGRLTVEAFIAIVASGGDPIDVLDLAGNRGIQARNTGMVQGDVQDLIEARRG
jgi:hypothetical protein